MGKASRTKRQKREKQPEVIQAPPEIAAAIDSISAEDRQWFEANPDADQRTRPAAPNEFWPNFDSASVRYVIVTQVRTGFRLRLPIIRIHRPEKEKVQ